ncbi:MAG: arylsulfatase [Planctomycetaceae bacterium]|nr:arylsulfatase [Planctomycetaceae bacterium]
MFDLDFDFGLSRILGGLFRAIYVFLVLLILGAIIVTNNQYLLAEEIPDGQVSRPNIILVLSDDMGYSDLGCYGGELTTPNLDQLASGGIRFTQFYNTARCCPTRASLITGLHPHQAGMGHMTHDQNLPGYQGDLLPSCVTIAEALKPAGYATYGIGKWHVTRRVSKGVDDRSNFPANRGFDKFYGIIGGATNYFEPTTLVRDNTPISYLNDPEYKPDKEYYLTNALSDNASIYIKDHKKNNPNKPFFMYVAFTAAHWPMQAPASDIAKQQHKYDKGYEPIRAARFERMKELGLIDSRWKLSQQAENWDKVDDKKWEAACMEVYAAMIECLDRGIGQIVNTLKETNQYENTVIIFLQDNGACAETVGRNPRKDFPQRINTPVYKPYKPEEIIFHRDDEKRTRDGYPVIHGKQVLPGAKDTFIAYGRGWANVSNTPFREYKHWVHEGGISTPLIIHAPSLIANSVRGTLYKEYGQLVDIMTTCVDLANANYPDKRNGINVTKMQGTSLKPALKGESLKRTTPLFWEHEGNRAIRSGQWKLVAKSPLGEWELYDIESDRTEQNNVAKSHPEIVERLSKEWEDWANRSNVLPWPWKTYNAAYDKNNGLRLELIFGNSEENPDDSSGNKNESTIHGNLKKNQIDNINAAQFDGETWIKFDRTPVHDCSENAWFVEAEVHGESNGIIISHGGERHGYSLFLKDKKPGLGVRIHGELIVIESKEQLNGWQKISAGITKEKKLQIKVGDKIVVEKQIGDFIDYPVDTVVVGADLNRHVIEPTLPNFTGNLKRVAIRKK